MTGTTKYLYNITGHITEISSLVPHNNAVVDFSHGEESGKAFLRSDKLLVNGVNLSQGADIKAHIQIGSKVVFGCHTYSTSQIESCNWFVTYAYCTNSDDLQLRLLGIPKLPIVKGIINKQGFIGSLWKTQIVIEFTSDSGREERALLLPSKLFLNGKRCTGKINLNIHDEVYFDAVPIKNEHKEENPIKCSWMVTVAWKGRGKKPIMSYDVSPNPLPFSNNVSIYKSALNNPHSYFLSGQGKIFQILSQEYGICLTAIKENIWHTVLFHRSNAYLFGSSLKSENLKEVFKKGDYVKFMAIPAGFNCSAQWIAQTLHVNEAGEELTK